MTRQTISYILFTVALALLIFWAVDGHQMWTTTQHMVQTKDELFGTVTETWEKQFTPGLEFIGPVAALCVGVGLWLMRKGNKAKAA